MASRHRLSCKRTPPAVGYEKPQPDVAWGSPGHSGEVAREVEVWGRSKDCKSGDAVECGGMAWGEQLPAGLQGCASLHTVELWGCTMLKDLGPLRSSGTLSSLTLQSCTSLPAEYAGTHDSRAAVVALLSRLG